MSKILREAGRTLAEATTSSGTAGLLEVEFITPGWGSSGYYSPAVVEAAVPLFAAGTQMFFDHASVSERADRPVRSVRDIAAVLESDAYLNPATGGIRGLVRPLKAYEALLTDETFALNVGLSIAGSATDINVGEAEGRTGPIIEGLAHVQSVDFVTRAGRGGRVLAVMESAGVRVEEARNIGQWIESRIHRDFTVLADDMAGDGRLTRGERIGLSSAIGDALAAFVANLEANQAQLYARDLWDALPGVTESGVAEATANDTRDALATTVRAAHSSEDRWVWVRDFDDTTVWFEIEDNTEGGESGIYAQTYTLTDGGAVLTSTRTKVRVQTSYVPVTPNVPVDPAGRTTTEESQEDTMPNIQIEESEHARLVQEAGRVTALEERATTAENALAAERAVSRARTLVTENAARRAAGVEFTPLEERGLLSGLPIVDGALNEAVFTETVDAAVAESTRVRGTGAVTGFGIAAGGTTQTGVTESDIDRAVAGAFGRQVKEA